MDVARIQYLRWLLDNAKELVTFGEQVKLLASDGLTATDVRDLLLAIGTLCTQLGQSFPSGLLTAGKAEMITEESFQAELLEMAGANGELIRRLIELAKEIDWETILMLIRLFASQR